MADIASNRPNLQEHEHYVYWMNAINVELHVKKKLNILTVCHGATRQVWVLPTETHLISKFSFCTAFHYNIYLHVTPIKHGWWHQNCPKIPFTITQMYSGGAVLELNHDVVKLTWKRKLILELLVTINGKTDNIRKIYFCSHCLIELILHAINSSPERFGGEKMLMQDAISLWITNHWSKALAVMGYKVYSDKITIKITAIVRIHGLFWLV